MASHRRYVVLALHALVRSHIISTLHVVGVALSDVAGASSLLSSLEVRFDGSAVKDDLLAPSPTPQQALPRRWMRREEPSSGDVSAVPHVEMASFDEVTSGASQSTSGGLRTSVVLRGATGDISSFWAESSDGVSINSDEAGKIAARLLRRMNLLLDSDGSCNPCTVIPSTQGCCGQWSQNGKNVTSVRALEVGKPTVLRVTMASEFGLDVGLVRFARSLSLDAGTYRRFGSALRSLGINETSHFARVDPAELCSKIGVTDMDPKRAIILNRIREQKAIAANAELNWHAARQRREDKHEEFLKKSADINASAELAEERFEDAKMAWIRAKAEGDSPEAIAAASKKQSHAERDLAYLKLQAAKVKVDTAANAAEGVKWAVDQLGLSLHPRLNVEQLIRKNGVLRGIHLTNTVHSTNLQEALQLTVKAGDHDSLEKAVLLPPDVKPSKLTTRSTKRDRIKQLDSFVDSFGTSAVNTSMDFKTTALARGLAKAGVDFAQMGLKMAKLDPKELGLGTGALDGNYEKLSTNVINEHSMTTEQRSSELQKKTYSLTTTKYYVEPRQLLSIDPGMLQFTPGFRRALRRVNETKGLPADSDANSYGVSHLLSDFGTHVCSRVMLGGLMKISVETTSKTLKKTADMVKDAIETINNMAEEKLKVSASASYANDKLNLTVMNDTVSSVSTDVGTEHATESKMKLKSNTKQKYKSKEKLRDKDEVTDTSKEWKGGTSGLDRYDWVKSLDREGNSNWRIIDRYVDTCRGVWRWVEDDADLRRYICEGWRKMYRDDCRKTLGRSVDEDVEKAFKAEWGKC